MTSRGRLLAAVLAASSMAAALALAAPPTVVPPEAVAPPAVLPCTAAPAETACVPGGWFTRGLDSDDHVCDQRPPKHRAANSTPAAKVWVQTFYMDLHEVTIASYKKCIAAGKCRKGSGPNYQDFSRDKQPVVGVTWHDAVAYCSFNGQHLPTEAEWEKAARGPDGAKQPWGDEPATCERAVIMDKSGRGCGLERKNKAGKRIDEVGRTSEVASRPAGAYGLHDMVGNAEEWTADWYSDDWSKCGAACTGIDPKGPCNGAAPCKGYDERAVRGGSWYWPAGHAAATHRRPHFPINKPFHHFGFRCASSTTEATAH